MRRTLAVAVLVLAGLLVGGPARAGGPTSVLLVVPGAGRTASLYTGQADYEELARLVGAPDAIGGSAQPAPSPAGGDPGADDPVAAGTTVTVTWLLHDVEVWRVDRIGMGVDGRPAIATQSLPGDGRSIWESPVVQHPATSGPALVALLDRLGVNPVAPTSAGPATASIAPVERPGIGSAAAGTVRDAATPASGPPGILWAAAGLAAGVLVTLVAAGRTGPARARRPAPG